MTQTPSIPDQPVDPWEMQRTLMAASRQAMPASPELNRGVLLYGALILEETAETAEATGQAARDAHAEVASLDAPARDVLAAVAHEYEQAHANAKASSLRLRALIERLPADLRATLARPVARDMADGATDVVVVCAGYALSMGADGAACYDEVAGSNLSKRNPDTGMVDVMPDGKWIKGRNYRQADLMRVLYGIAD